MKRPSNTTFLTSAAPWLHPFIEDLIVLRAVPFLKLRIRTLALVVLPLVTSSLTSESQVSHVPFNRLMPSSGHLSCRMPLRP